MWDTFCGLVVIKLERALSELYDSLDVGLNLSVRKLHTLSTISLKNSLVVPPSSTAHSD